MYETYYYCEKCDESWVDRMCSGQHTASCPKCQADIAPMESRLTDEALEVRCSYHQSGERWYGEFTTSCGAEHPAQTFIAFSERALLGELLQQLRDNDLLKHPIKLTICEAKGYGG